MVGSFYEKESERYSGSKSPLSDPNLLSKSTSKCEHCETRFTVLKFYEVRFERRDFLIDADSGPPRYVL